MRFKKSKKPPTNKNQNPEKDSDKEATPETNPRVKDQGHVKAHKISAKRYKRMHKKARKRRASHLVAQRLLRVFLLLFLRIAWRPKIEGKKFIPKKGSGALLIAANHRSALDPLLLALAYQQPMRFLATSDMFVSRLKAMIFLALGAIPVQRGEGDKEAVHTIEILIASGETVCVFPEGRLVRRASKDYLEIPEKDWDTWASETSGIVLGNPKHGIGYFAAKSSTPVLPAAIVGTDYPSAPLWRRGAEMRLAFSPVIYPYAEGTLDEKARKLVDTELWPGLEKELAQLEKARKRDLATGAGVGLSAIGMIVVGIMIKKRS